MAYGEQTDKQPVGETPTKAAPAEQSGEDLLEELQKDLDRLKGQKARPTGGVEGTTLLNLCFLNDEQYVNYRSKTLGLEAQDANKLYLTFNLIGPRFNKWMGRMSAFNAPFKARPNKQDPQALEEAEVVDRMILGHDEILDEPSRMRERLFWLGVGGVAVEFIPWLPNATIAPEPQFDEAGELLFRDLEQPDSEPVPQSYVDQMVQAGRAPESFEIYEVVQQTGEIGSEIFGPFNVFLDSAVRSIADLAPDQWLHLAKPRTVGWVKENFDEEVEPQTEISLISSTIKSDGGESLGGVYLKDLIPMVQGQTDANDPKMVLFVQSFQPASKDHPHGRYVCWIPKQKVLHDADNPYEEIPAVDFHFSPVTTSFWTKAYVTPLIAPQRFVNKRMSQLGEQANAAVYANLLLGAGLTEADIPADFPGVVKNGLNEAGLPNVGRIPPPELPSWFLPSIELAVKMFNDASGGADLMEDNKFPGQLRGPMAVPMLQEILDTQWGPLFNHLGERLARVKQLRLNRAKQFYPPLRTMHFTSKTQKDEVLTFHTEKILRAGTNYSVTVERGSILPELRALRESRLAERLKGPLAILYMDERTGRLDKSKIAADLQFGDTGREGREATYRKLAMEIIKLLWEAKQPPPVMQFYDHAVMLDELENAMATTEFLKASPQVQQLFQDRWAQHTQFLQQEAMAQQQAMQQQLMHSAVAQATQQAAAQAASDAVMEAREQDRYQQQVPTDQLVHSAADQGQQARANDGRAPAPKVKKRKMTFEEQS